jgi:alpha-galactosidase
MSPPNTSQAGISAQAGPGKGWNDPDILEIGVNYPVWGPALPGIDLVEGRTQFSLWCVTSAPLLLGFDATQVSDAIVKIVSNADAVAVNQQWAGSAS